MPQLHPGSLPSAAPVVEGPAGPAVMLPWLPEGALKAPVTVDVGPASTMLERPPLTPAEMVALSAPPALLPAPMTLMLCQSPVMSLYWYSVPGE